MFASQHHLCSTTLRHDVEVDGHSAALWLAPQVKTSLIVLANVGGDAAKRLTQKISRVVVGSLA